MANINKVKIRMYRLGTGDCFALKFYAGNSIKFKMMIDGGVCFPAPSRAKMSPIINDLRDFVKGQVDALVITHEHYDHVSAFERCATIFKEDFTFDRIWMAWTENDNNGELKDWKEEFKEWKNNVALSAYHLEEAINARGGAEFKKQFNENKFGEEMLGARKNLSKIVNGFANTNIDAPAKQLGKLSEAEEEQEPFIKLSIEELDRFAARGDVQNSLRGMRIIKNEIAQDNISYYASGDIITTPDVPAGIKVYVLGPSKTFERIWELEAHQPGEAYEHSENMESHHAFANAIKHFRKDRKPSSLLPFDDEYVVDTKNGEPKVISEYMKKENEWRKIDYDWLYSSGNLALRLERLVNNLSLVLAIEFEETGEVLLFPGDAEYGSWKSWHEIDWAVPDDCSGKNLTEKLLNQTIFYKVAHHMSHNGTAKRLGLDMMTNPKLSAMGTVDYNKISTRWKNTMPNRFIMDDLLIKTKGRVILMNEEGIEYNNQSLTDRIKAAQANMSPSEKENFNKNYDSDNHYHEWTIRI